MKRKDYLKPTIQIVELQHKTMLLQASPGQAKAQNYDWHDVDEE